MCCSGGQKVFDYRSEIKSHLPKHGGLDFNNMCHAGHGLSLLLVGEMGGIKRSCLFDAGPDPTLFKDNVAKMKLGDCMSHVEAVVLSHYHIDHSGGLRAAVPMIAEGRQAAAAPPVIVDLHPSQPLSRGTKNLDGTFNLFLPAEPNFDELGEYGAQVATSSAAHTICSDYFLVSGEIPRETDFETGMNNHWSLRKEGGNDSAEGWVSDGLVMDERCLIVKVRGKGTIVFSACSHAGIVNVVRHAVEIAGGPLCAVMGGLHLAPYAIDDPRLQKTVEGLVTHVCLHERKFFAEWSLQN